MMVVDMDEARARLPELVDRAVAGEPFVIGMDGGPLVRVMALDAPTAARRLGFLAGEIRVPDDFNDIGAAEIATLSGVGGA